MIKKLRKITSLVTMVAIFFSYTITPAIAATKLSPRHLYYWAQTKNYSRLNQFKRYINLQNEDNKTALCLAQEAKDRNSYATLLKFGASTDVDCHDDDDPICAVIVDKKNKISPAWLLLGAGAIGAAYILSDDGGSSDKSEPTLCDASFNFKDTCPNGMTETGRCKDINGTHLKCKPIDCSQYTEATCAYTGIKIDKECTTNNAEGTNEVTTYQCACADGWNPGSCPIGKTCDTVTTPVECYTNERCPDDYSLTTKDNEDIFSYSQSAEGTGCYKITGCNTANGWQQGTCDPSHTSCQQEEQNGIQCYKVEACNIATYPFDTSCPDGMKETARCSDASGTHLSCACDESQNHFSDQTKCTQNNAGQTGYDCSNQDENGCYTRVELVCVAPNADECEPAKGGYILTDIGSKTYAGETECRSCTYSCNETTHFNTCPTGYTCKDDSQGGTTCQIPQSCDNTTQFDTCPAGFNCASNTQYNITCYTKLSAKCDTNIYNSDIPCRDIEPTIRAGYANNLLTEIDRCTETLEDGTTKTYYQCACDTNKTVTSVGQCGNGTAGENGWYLNQTSFSMYNATTVTCNTCEEKNCENGGIYQFGNQCPSGYENLSSDGIAFVENSYSGDNQCYNCNYKCKDGLYNDESSCIQAAGNGKSCTPLQTPIYDGRTITCYQIGTCDASFNFKDTCPNGMTETGRCKDINGTHLKCKPIDCSQYTEATCAYTGIKIDKECTTNNAEGTNEVTTYQCACADGWNPGSCPIGKTCDTVTTPVECYTNERCPDDYSLTTKDNEDIFSYSQSAEGTGCYKITGCNTANGWQQGTCNPSYTSCQQEEQNGIQCYKVNACDRSSYPFDTCNAGTISTASCTDTSGTYHQCACDTDNGYYSEDLGLTQCGQGGENGWEWANTQTPSQNGTTLTCSTCKAKECNDKNYNPQTGQCTLHDNLKATQGSNDGWSGNNQCFTCIYECATGLYQDEDSCNQATQNGEYCIKVDNDLNIACYDTTSCPTEYPNTFTSKEVCEQGGYTCQQSPSVPGCFKRDVLACTQGSTDITTSYCATTNGGSENSWTLKDTGYVSGGKKCYECDAVNDCATGTSSDYINATSCPTQNYKKATSSPINGKYNGSAQCYECSYTCDESQNAYSNEDNCKTDNTGCTYDTTSQCWIIGTSCPNGQDLSPTDLTICGTYPTYVTAFKSQSGATSGEDACYKCSYTCNTSMAGIYNDQTSCENNTQNEKAYSCTKDETYGCYQRGEPLSCTQGATTCEPAKEGFTLSDEENGYYTGETPCLTCTYSCNGSTHVTAENKKEGLDYTEVTEHGVTCYYAPVCPTTHPNTYASKEDCEEGGYSCIESATGSGCFSRTAKTCDEVTKGSVLKCTDYDGYTTTPTKAGLAGGNQCYTCSYSCDEETYFPSNDNSMFEYEDIYDGPEFCYKPTSCAMGYTEATDTNPSCPTGNAYQSSISQSTLGSITCYSCSYSCKAGWTDTEPSPGTPYIAERIPGSEERCYQEIACNEDDYKYSSQEACEQNGLFTCEQENEIGCWIATDCGSQTSTSTCSGNNNAFTIQTSTHHGYNTTCYSCAYECNTTNGYKPNSQLNSTTQCGTYGDNVYKLDTQTITASDNTLITCNKCVVDNCSDTGFEVGGCSEYSGLNLLNGSSVGKMENGNECFVCDYECIGDYYNNEDLCTSDAEDEGKTCTTTDISIAHGSKTCWQIGSCDASYNFLNTCPDGMKETARCSDGTGDHLKCEPINCSEYTEPNCNDTTGNNAFKGTSCTTNNAEGTSPTTTYQCACADGWTLGSCPLGNTCTEVTNHGISCYKDATCDNSQGYYTQSECSLNAKGEEGYDCTLDTTSGCYTRTPKVCPDGYTVESDIIKEEWTYVTSQYTSGYSGENRCYRYELKCFEAKNAYSACPTGYSCEEKTTTATSISTGNKVSNQLTCYIPNACDEEIYFSSGDNSAFSYSEQEGPVACYKPTSCAEGYTKSEVSNPSCETSDGYQSTANVYTYTQDNLTCYNCSYSCKAGWTDTEPTNTPYIYDIAPNDLYCYKATTCDSGEGKYDNNETCEQNGFFTCAQENGTGCWIATGCQDGYYSEAQQNPNENVLKQIETYKSSGNISCYSYSYSCNDQYYTYEENVNKCIPENITHYTGTATNLYTLNNKLTCYQCEYECAGGYTSDNTSLIGIPHTSIDILKNSYTNETITCYSKITTCNNGEGKYDNKETCEKRDGNNVFTCEQENGTGCWIASACADGYNNTSCPTDTYDSHILSQTHYETNTQTGVLKCYTPCIASCDTTAGWSDNYQSTLDCFGGNVLGDNAYKLLESTILEQTCKTCINYSCTGATTTNEIFFVGGCPEIDGLNDLAITENGTYEGQQCYNCQYECDKNDGYYTDPSECEETEETSCTINPIMVGTYSYTCYVSDTNLTLLNSNTKISNTTLIEKTSTGTEDVYGLSSDSDIENTVDEATNSVGQIKITHNSTGNAYGMYGSSSNHLLNEKGASINITNNSTGSAVGMYASRGGTAINKGDITITGTTGTAVGILGEGQNYIANQGTINVSGQDAYGIRVLDGTNTTIINEGSITVNGQNEAYGIYVDQNASADTVTNTGSITVNGNQNDTSRAIVLNGAKLRNAGLMSVAGELNLNSLGASTVYLEDGATYEAKSISGELTAGTSTVMDNNLDTYIKKNAIISDNTDKLNIKSESALFDAKTKTNSDGNVDVVLERKEFSEFTPNNSISDYLTQNYQAKNFENAFNSLKSATTTMAVKNYLADFMGYDKLLNFADENFNVLRSLNRTMADTILKPTDEPYRVVAGYDNFNLETDDKGMLSGYDLNAHSMFTFGDKRLSNWSRLGLGISFTDMNTSYEKGGSRDLNMVSIFMPYLRKFSDKLNLVTILNLGYGYGDYERGADRESDLEEIIYGLTNELRYNINLNGFAELEPALMLNAIGYTEDGFNEKDAENAIKTKRTNNLSVELGAGLFVKKEVKMEKYGKLGFKIGGVYYHEFVDPYRDITVRHKNGIGPWYNINDYANLYQRDRAVLEAVIDYAYKDLSLYLKYNKLIQKNNPDLFDMGIKYNF